MMEFDNIKCKTETCSWYNIVVPIEANGVEIVCSGECQNILRADNPDHPNYPVIEELAETLEEKIRKLIQEELGNA